LTRYVAGRVVFGIVTLAAFVTGLFVLLTVVVPGDFTSQFILTADQRAALEQQLGLDRSLWEQYVSWIQGVVTLDLGVSLGGVEVWEALRETLASTLLVLGAALGAAFFVGARLGRITAWSRRRVITGGVSILSIIMLTMFPPALGFLLERGALNSLGRPTVSAMRNLDPGPWQAAGFLSPGALLWRVHLSIVIAVALGCLFIAIVKRRRRAPSAAIVTAALGGGLVVVWLLLGWWGLLVDVAGRVALITLALAVLTVGDVILITRASMEDAVSEDFVTVARAKGLPDKEVRDRHAARAALLPILSRLVVSIPYLLTSLVILESIFHAGGIGTLIFEGLRLEDTPLVAGALLVVGALTVVLRVCLDVAHAALDPRIRFGGVR